MTTIWLTYAWVDNEDRDVDYIAQELAASGIKVKLDRWNLVGGRRLWEQISNFIQNPEECDAWVMYATQNSLGSEPCKEEFEIAFNRALESRGAFPIICLFPASIDSSLVSPRIKNRLFVNLTDADWKERIISAAEGRSPSVERPNVDPYFLRIHQPASLGGSYSIEIRPRAGTWSPFAAAIPFSEKNNVVPSIIHGPPNATPSAGMLVNCGSCQSDDGEWWVEFAGNEATPTQSYYLQCRQLPSKLIFGVANGEPRYLVDIKSESPDSKHSSPGIRVPPLAR